MSETAAMDALAFQQHCHYSGVVNPLEFCWSGIKPLGTGQGSDSSGSPMWRQTNQQGGHCAVWPQAGPQGTELYPGSFLQ